MSEFDEKDSKKTPVEEIFTTEELINISSLRNLILQHEDFVIEEEKDRIAVEAATKACHQVHPPTIADSGPEQVLYKYQLDTSTLWRFHTAHVTAGTPEATMAAALDMFIHSFRWKRDINMPQLLQDWNIEATDDTKANSSRTEEAKIGLHCFYAGNLSTDVRTIRGGPVMVERLGKIDLAGLYADETAQNAVLDSYKVYLETAWNRVRTLGGLSVCQSVSLDVLMFLSLMYICTYVYVIGMYVYMCGHFR